MMKCPGLVFAALFAFVALSAAHRRGSSRNNYNNNNGRAPLQGFYSWRRDLGSNRQCNEFAYAPPGDQAIYSTSSDSVLPYVGITPSSSVYDFTNAVAVGAIIPEGGACYYTNSTLSFGQTIDNLNTINNTQISAVEPIPLDGTATPLADSEIANIFAAYPATEPLCAERPVIQTYPQGAAPVAYTGPTEVLQVFTLTSAVNIRVRRPTRGSQGGRQQDDDSRDKDNHHRHRHNRRH